MRLDDVLRRNVTAKNENDPQNEDDRQPVDSRYESSDESVPLTIENEGAVESGKSEAATIALESPETVLPSSPETANPIGIEEQAGLNNAVDSGDEIGNDENGYDEDEIAIDFNGSDDTNAQDRNTDASAPITSLHWQALAPPVRGRVLWSELPGLNQFFVFAAGLCFCFALTRAIVPPAVAGVQRAVYPYTTAGKRDTCLSNLRTLALAMETYAQDYDSRFAPLDYQGASNQRNTWVRLLQKYSEADTLNCPEKAVAAEQRGTLSSYGLNPVLPGLRSSDLADPGETILLADRGDDHDVALLPPFASWPVPRKASGAANLDFRHENEAAVVYADGHAASRTGGEWLKDMTVWGGVAVRQSSSVRLLQTRPFLRQVRRAIQKGDEHTARQLLKASRKAALTAFAEVRPLWDGVDPLERNQWLDGWGQALLRPRAKAVRPPRDRNSGALPYLDEYPIARQLDPSDIAGHSRSELRLMRNAIFARHGRPFRDAQLQRFFSRQTWYHQDDSWSTPGDDDRRLSALEQRNAQYLLGKSQ